MWRNIFHSRSVGYFLTFWWGKKNRNKGGERFFLFNSNYIYYIAFLFKKDIHLFIILKYKRQVDCFQEGITCISLIINTCQNHLPFCCSNERWNVKFLFLFFLFLSWPSKCFRFFYIFLTLDLLGTGLS